MRRPAGKRYYVPQRRSLVHFDPEPRIVRSTTEGQAMLGRRIVGF